MNSTIDLIPLQPYLEANREIDGHSLRILSRQFPLDGEELIDNFFASVTTPNSLDELKVVEEAGTSPSIVVPEGEFGSCSPIQNLKKRKIDGGDYIDALDIDKFVNELTPLRSVPDQLPYFNQYQITPNQWDGFNFDRQLGNPRLGDFQPQSYDYAISVFAEQRVEQGNRTRINSCDSNITNPNSESDKIPRSQLVKSEYDQYTPRWVRYSGSKKEGLCEICVPGKWLQLKNSAYWYHKQYSHGISSVTGMKFEMPTSCRACWLSAIESSKDLGLYLSVEGFCDNCENWIQLYKNKKRFVHSLGSIEDLIKIIYDTGATEIVSKNPLKIVAIIRNGRLVVPKIVNIGSNVEKQVVSSMSGAVGSLWYKHAHKCHVVNKTEELE